MEAFVYDVRDNVYEISLLRDSDNDVGLSLIHDGLAVYANLYDEQVENVSLVPLPQFPEPKTQILETPTLTPRQNEPAKIKDAVIIDPLFKIIDGGVCLVENSRNLNVEKNDSYSELGKRS